MPTQCAGGSECGITFVASSIATGYHNSISILPIFNSLAATDCSVRSDGNRGKRTNG